MIEIYYYNKRFSVMRRKQRRRQQPRENYRKQCPQRGRLLIK